MFLHVDALLFFYSSWLLNCWLSVSTDAIKHAKVSRAVEPFPETHCQVLCIHKNDDESRKRSWRRFRSQKYNGNAASLIYEIYLTVSTWVFTLSISSFQHIQECYWIVSSWYPCSLEITTTTFEKRWVCVAFSPIAMVRVDSKWGNLCKVKYITRYLNQRFPVKMWQFL